MAGENVHDMFIFYLTDAVDSSFINDDELAVLAKDDYLQNDTL